jgi:alpha-N-arabinofuranosidase
MTAPGGSAWRQTTFHPFAAVAASARGLSLVTRVQTTKQSTKRYGDVPSLAAAATYNPEDETTTVFLTNRAAQPTTVELRHRSFPHWATQSARVLAADDHGPRHEIEAAQIGLSGLHAEDDHASGTTRITVPPHSWGTVHASNRAPR